MIPTQFLGSETALKSQLRWALGGFQGQFRVCNPHRPVVLLPTRNMSGHASSWISQQLVSVVGPKPKVYN